MNDIRSQRGESCIERNNFVGPVGTPEVVTELVEAGLNRVFDFGDGGLGEELI